MTDNPLLSSARQADDADAALRPKTLAEFVGQAAAKDNLRVFIESAKSCGGMKFHGRNTMRAAHLVGAVLALALAGAAAAQDMSKFTDGPVITGFGKVTPIESDLPIPKNTVFKVMLDGSAAAKPGEVNRTLDSAARFLNMHVAAGVPEKNIHIVVVIHGKAGDDLTSDAFYAARNEGKPNATAPLIKQLVAHGVQIYICGQSATAFGISKADLLPGVKMSLSAMSTFALFEKQGYVLLP